MAKFGIKAPAAYRRNVIQGQLDRMTPEKQLEYLNNMWPEDKKLFKGLAKKIKNS